MSQETKIEGDDQANNYSEVMEKCLQNFTIGQKIGAGTFSKVCIAKHKLTHEQVAIKIIQKSKIQNQADKIRLDRQIKIMRKVRHPYISQLYQIIQTKNYIYLIMEYASRGELFDYIVSHQKLTQIEASKFLLQLIDAIQYIHSLGIAHRDLKPENLLLDYKFNIKVTDFGLSNIYAKGKTLSTACGSPSYACPEMLSGRPYYGLKGDIWSAGVILYAMCFGYLPFDNPNISELYRLIKQGQFEIPEFASTNLRDILIKILQKNPAKRISLDQIRSHPFCKFSNSIKQSTPVPGIILGLSDIPFQPFIEDEMRSDLKLNLSHLRQQIRKNKHNQNTCTYYLLLQRWLRINNKSLSNYYLQNFNKINRYSLIQKVKANFDKTARNKMEIKKFLAVQQQIKSKQLNYSNSLLSQKPIKHKQLTDYKGNRASYNKYSKNSQRILRSQEAQKNERCLKQNQEIARYKNAKKLDFETDKKQKRQNISPKKVKSKSVSNAKNLANKTNQDVINNSKKKLLQSSKRQHYLRTPDQFLSKSRKIISKQHTQNTDSKQKKKRLKSSEKRKYSKSQTKKRYA